jgi:hypothetical protein
MGANGRMQRTAIGISGALLVALFLSPVLAGSAVAAPTPASATAQWAYGGQDSSNGNFVSGNGSVSWNATFGLVVIFTATATGAGITELEEQRTVMVAVSISGSSGNLSASYNLKAVETDTAYANVTNASTVYVLGVPVAALGVLNASIAAQASLTESAAVSVGSLQASASLDVAASAFGSVSFSPSLGLIPLNLTGVSAWNSTATANPAAAWNLSYGWQVHDLNGSVRSGTGGNNGSWNASGPVYLSGHAVSVGIPRFHDGRTRTGVVLALVGPADLYDGFIFVPHGFDLFGGAAQSFDTDSMGNATISGETVFVTEGAVGPGSVSAAEATYGATYVAPTAFPGAPHAAVPAASSSPGTTVTAQPESVSSAQSQAACFQSGCASSAPWFSGLVAVAVIALAVGAVAGTAGVIEWRAYARRKSRQQLVGGYGAQLNASNVPPGAAVPPTPEAPGNPPSGPEPIERQL